MVITPISVAILAQACELLRSPTLEVGPCAAGRRPQWDQHCSCQSLFVDGPQSRQQHAVGRSPCLWMGQIHSTSRPHCLRCLRISKTSFIFENNEIHYCVFKSDLNYCFKSIVFWLKNNNAHSFCETSWKLSNTQYKKSSLSFEIANFIICIWK